MIATHTYILSCFVNTEVEVIFRIWLKTGIEALHLCDSEYIGHMARISGNLKRSTNVSLMVSGRLNVIKLPPPHTHILSRRVSRVFS